MLLRSLSGWAGTLPFTLEDDSNPLPPALAYAEAKRSLKRTSTTGQGTSQCLSVMVTTTVCPTMRYSPLTNSCEKRPDLSSPRRMAPFLLAALLALASSEVGATLVSTLKVLATIYFLPYR